MNINIIEQHTSLPLPTNTTPLHPKQPLVNFSDNSNLIMHYIPKSPSSTVPLKTTIICGFDEPQKIEPPKDKNTDGQQVEQQQKPQRVAEAEEDSEILHSDNDDGDDEPPPSTRRNKQAFLDSSLHTEARLLPFSPRPRPKKKKSRLPSTITKVLDTDTVLVPLSDHTVSSSDISGGDDRVVRFSPDIAIHYVKRRKDMRNSERKNVWYRNSELKEIRKEGMNIRQLMRTGEMIQDTEDDSILGLDRETMNYVKQKSAHRSLMLSLVFDEQSAQKREGIYDPELLAEKYKEFTAKSRYTLFVETLQDRHKNSFN